MPTETVHFTVVFGRDGWICGICSEPIPLVAVVPHPLAATIDHIVPLALGGPHVYENVQAAHFLCNSLKGANPMEVARAVYV